MTTQAETHTGVLLLSIALAFESEKAVATRHFIAA